MVAEELFHLDYDGLFNSGNMLVGRPLPGTYRGIALEGRAKEILPGKSPGDC